MIGAALVVVAAMAAAAAFLGVPAAAPRTVETVPMGNPPVRSLPPAVVRLTAPLRRRREALALGAALPDLLEQLARQVRAGASLRLALLTAVPSAPGPLGDDLRLVAADLERGVGLAEALDRWRARRPDVAGITLVAAALTIASEAGGSVARALDGVADTVRDDIHLRAEVRALASQAEASAVLVAALPLAFAAVAALADADTLRFLVATRIGLTCLVVGVGLDLFALWWMRRITSGISS